MSSDLYPARNLPCAFCGNEQTKLNMLGNFLWCPYCKHETPVGGDADLKQNLERVEYLWPDWSEENFEGVGGHPNFIDPRHVPTFGPTHQGAWIFEASKIDWLMSRPDKFKETREGQSYLQWMQANPQYDHLFPWMWSQARKGEIYVDPSTGQPHMTQEQGMPNMQGINNYSQAYEVEYGFRPHWMPMAPEDFQLDYQTYGMPYSTTEHPATYGAMLERLQTQQRGMVNDQPYELWKQWREPTDPIDQPKLDRWAGFAKDKQHPVRQEAGNIDQLTPKEFDAHANSWDFEKNNSQPVFNYNNGWTIRQLTNAQECRYEGDHMGHCVGQYSSHIDSGNALVYSLRDKQNRPHVTFEITPPHTYHSPTVDLAHLETTFTTPEDWANYGMDRDRVHEINQALLHGSNQPFASPQEGQAFRTLARAFPGSYPASSPYGGTMQQIQGKETQGGHEGVNTTPIDKYQKMLKHFFLTHFDDQTRPRWDDIDIGNIEELNSHYSDDDDGYVKYHPGDYGLNEPHIYTHTADIADEIAEGHNYGGYSNIDDDAAQLLARHSIDNGDHAETQSHIHDSTERAADDLRSDIADRMYDVMDGWDEDNPQPDPEDFMKMDGHGYATEDHDYDAYQEAYDKWQENRDEAEREHHDSEFESAWEENPWKQLKDTFDEESHRYKREQARRANPWHKEIWQSAPHNAFDARRMYMDAVSQGNVHHLQQALDSHPQGQWTDAHRALQQHLDHHES